LASRAPDSQPEPASIDEAPTRHGRSIRLQTRAVVGNATDPQEEEADRVAAEVVQRIRRDLVAAAGSGIGGEATAGRMARSTAPSAPSAPSGRRDRSGAPTTIGRVQRKSPIGAAGGEISLDTERAISSMRGSGAGLAEPVRRTMERSFGADFGGVRVHEGARARDLNVELGAEAFTTGNDIFFRDGLPSATSSAGQELLAHELTHTIQQGGRSEGPDRSIRRT